jgi:glycosyltransferase involved in cell wall biosynthesis
MPSVSVIVPARDAASTLPRTLAALTGQDYPGEYEVIVVDDGSRDATAQAARAPGPPVIVVQQPQLGPAAARNRGVATARARRLAFCDADVFPGPGWLAAGVAALDGADLVQGRVQPDPEVARGPFDRTLWIDADVGLWETANLFVTRVAFERAGGFVEWIRPRRGKALAEDVWFGYRALRAGARPAFCAQALANHAVFARHWTEYVGERARLRFFPAMAARMPELRAAFLHRRLFLNPRTAQLDAALLALAWATHRRRPGALLAALPYARSVRRAAVGRAADSAPPADPVVVAAADVAADLVGLAALLYGSLRYRAAVL